MLYLMVKTHNKTGLKYLCKTVQDPFLYKGSGKYWLLHLKKHGTDVKTEILLETTNEKELIQKGIEYSILWNVVESEEWANLRIEEGDGGATVTSKKWITNGEKEYYISSIDILPAGWYYGRVNKKIFKNSVPPKPLPENNIIPKIKKTQKSKVQDCRSLTGDNRTEAQKLASQIQKEKIKGRIPHNKGNKFLYGKPIKTPVGIFRNGIEVAEYYGITSGTVTYRCKKGLYGFEYVEE